MLRFAEEIMVLLLDDEGREFARMPMWRMRTVFAAAVLMDLALENRIDTDLDRLFPVSPKPLEDDLLDPTLARIGKADIRETHYWLERVALDGDDIRQLALARLVERGILRHQGRHSPWTFRPRRYPILDGAAQRNVKARLVRALTGADIPAPRDIALVCLADACGVLEKLLSDRQPQQVAMRLEQIRKMDLIGRTLSDTVWRIRATLVSEKLKKPLIGLALGAGAARGWAHVGVIKRLSEAGIVPDVVAGTSAGALVGGFYAAGKLDPLEAWARNMTLGQVANYMTLSPGRGLFGSKRFYRDLAGHCRGIDVDRLRVPFAAVTTELETGQEFWLRSGPLLRVVSASFAYPGIFPPVKVNNRWMIDGTLTNPVPVSACRGLGAQLVIAVPLNQDSPGKISSDASVSTSAASHGEEGTHPAAPNLFSMMKSLLRPARTHRSQADLVIRPQFNGHVLPGLSHADAAIAEGRRAADLALRTLDRLYSALA